MVSQRPRRRLRGKAAQRSASFSYPASTRRLVVLDLANHTTTAGGALLANVRLHPLSTSIVAERVRQEREQGASLRVIAQRTELRPCPKCAGRQAVARLDGGGYLAFRRVGLAERALATTSEPSKLRRRRYSCSRSCPRSVPSKSCRTISAAARQFCVFLQPLPCDRASYGSRA